MKRQIVLSLSVLLVFMMACSFGSTPTPDVPTEIPTDIPPTPIPVTVEEANNGMHHYWMTPHENGCDASEGSDVPTERDKEHIFASDFSTVTYGGREYFQVGEHRYQSINQNDKPLVLEFSEQGFVLYVYNAGDDPNFTEPCLYFDFVFQE